jgi:hypothetical protein
MDDRADDLERNRSGYRYRRCIVCDGRIRLIDSCADRRVETLDGPSVERGHRACLKEGVERWLRLGRPHSDPLEASRRDGWRWHAEPAVRIDG